MPSLTIWTRLEPRCRTADMTIALEARTHDPFWMLARQWQLGELTRQRCRIADRRNGRIRRHAAR